MSHVESYSLNSEKDRELIKWLRKPGRNKSDVVKKALYLYKKFGDVLDLPEIAERLVALPEIAERLSRIEKQLSHVSVVADTEVMCMDDKPDDVVAALDIMAGMDCL